jgi:acyl-CoA thioesterase FadM
MATTAVRLEPDLRLRLQLRRRDIDRLGHLNHGAYGELFFEARSALLDPVRSDTSRYVLARIEIDFLREVRLSDGHVDVTAAVAGIRGKSFDLIQEMLLPDGTVAARSRVVLVAWDVRGRRSRALTPTERTALGAATAA